MRIDCAGGILISPQKLAEQTEKREGLAGSNHSICFESDATGMSGEAGEITVDDVLGHVVPGRMDVLVDGHGPEGGGCYVPDEVQTDCWTVCDAKCAGLCLAHVPPTVALRECSDGVCAGYTLLQAAELSREWQREMVVVQLDVRKAFDHVEHRAAFKAMKLQGLSLFSMALIAAIWRGNCMRARLGNCNVEQNSDEQRGCPKEHRNLR